MIDALPSAYDLAKDVGGLILKIKAAIEQVGAQSCMSSIAPPNAFPLYLAS